MTTSSEQSAAFIETAIAISDTLALGRPSDTPIEDLISSISNDFNVNIRSGNNWSNLLFSSSGPLTFTIGYGGNDFMIGRSGTDVMFGGAGNDYLFGRSGDDALFGGTGHDSLFGGRGNDFLRGGEGNDYIRAGSGDDTLEGGDGNDYLFGNSGADDIFGGQGDDYIRGGDGNDFIHLSSGDDYILAGRGNDVAEGGFGDDYINGGQGNDFIWGGSGDDILRGGEGSDRFFFDPANQSEGNDVIQDFTFGEDSFRIFINGVLAATPDLANADGDPELDLGSDLDASLLWLLQSSDDGDLQIVHPNGTIELDGVEYDDALTFTSLIEDGTFDFF